MYFGDHPYSDLADVTLEHGWRTGAIISELEVSTKICHICQSRKFNNKSHFLQHEIDTLNNPEFKTNANWLQMLTQLIEGTTTIFIISRVYSLNFSLSCVHLDYQDIESDGAKAALRKWNAERDQLR